MIFIAFVTFGLVFSTALHRSVAEDLHRSVAEDLHRSVAEDLHRSVAEDLHRSVAEENDSKTVTNLLNNMTGFATSDTISVSSASSETLTSSSFSDVKTLLDTITLASTDKISFTPSLEIKTDSPSYHITIQYSDAISSSASSLGMATVFPLSQIATHYSDEITPSVSLDMTAVSHPSHITVNYSDTITPTVSLNMTTFFAPSQITVNYSDTITPTSSLNKTFSTSYKMTSSLFLTVINSSPSESITESRFNTNPPSTQTESPTCFLECYINISFTTKKNSTQLGNEINEVLSYEFKIAAYNGYLYLIFLKISAQTNNSVTYWFDLLFQKPYCDSILKQEVLTKSQSFSGKTISGYTILPNSLQIKPFEIPPSRNKLLSLEMKLEGDFNNELKNKNSEEYKILEYKMIRNLTFLMESFRGFVKVIINGFEEGSIVVKAQLLFDIDEIKVTDEEIKKDIEIKLIRYLGLLNDTICGYKVDIESFKFDRDVVVLQKSSSFPSWLIVLIVALCVVVPLIIILIEQKRKTKKLKDMLKSPVDDQPPIRHFQMKTPALDNQNNTNANTHSIYRENVETSPRGKTNPMFDCYDDLTEITF